MKCGGNSFFPLNRRSAVLCGVGGLPEGVAGIKCPVIRRAVDGIRGRAKELVFDGIFAVAYSEDTQE